VGVVADTRSRGLQVEPSAEIYVPHGLYGPESMTIAVRSRPRGGGAPGGEEILREMDPRGARLPSRR
jgi:hypothetical protein